MSSTAIRESKATRRACQQCRERKARFQYAGAVRADKDHTLCFECYRAERERRRAQLLATVPPASSLRLPGGRGDAPFRRHLEPRAIEHRRRMLAHLQSVAGRR